MPLAYAGRPSVFSGDLDLPKAEKDYEVLTLRASAIQVSAPNFGFQERGFKLKPR